MTQSEIVRVGLAWLGTYLFHSTLLLGAAWLLTRTRLFSLPHLAERCWRLALVGGVLTASLQVGSGYAPLCGSLRLPQVAQAERAHELRAAPARLPDPSAQEASLPGLLADRPEYRTATLAPRRESAPPAGSDGADRVSSKPRTPRRDARSEDSPKRARGTRRSASDDEPTPAGGIEREDVSTRESAGSGESTTRFATLDERAKGSRDASDGAAPAARLAALEAPFSTQGPALGADSSAANTLLPAGTTQATGSPLPWKDGLMALWLVVAGLGLAGFLWAASRLVVLLSDKREIVSGPLRERLDQLCEEAGVRKSVRLFASETLVSPITYGWIGRRICVPTRVLTHLSASQQASLLGHELAHAVRRDPLWFSAYALLERVLFFQPLNRMARRRLQDSAELICDEWAVRWTGGRLALASCLTEIAQWIVGRHTPALTSPGMASRPSQLGLRVERLLEEEARPAAPARHAWWFPSATGGLALVVLAVPGVSSLPAGRAPAAPRTPVTLAQPAAAAPDLAPDAVRTEDTLLLESALLPAPATDSVPMPLGLTLDSELLSEELALLDLELVSLRVELRSTGEYERFERALAQLEERIDSLHQRRERLHTLLTLLASTLVPQTDAEPGSDSTDKD